MLSANPESAGHSVLGDQFLVHGQGLVGFLGGAGHLGTVTADPLGRDGVTAWALRDRAAVDPGEEMILEPVWAAGCSPVTLYSAYARLWGGAGRARSATAGPGAGRCSRYQYFTRVNPQAVRAIRELAARHGLGVLKIADGYQQQVGEWLSVRDGWGPLGELARDTGRAGLRPGMWMAPLTVAERAPTAEDHSDWLPRDCDGKPVRAYHDQQEGRGRALALDTTNPAVLEHLRRVFADLVAKGFTYHQADFGYAAAVPGRHYDPRATGAQALRRGPLAVREGIRDASFQLAGGCPFAPAVGLVDAMRVSIDPASEWERRSHQVVSGYRDSTVSLANALGTSLLRAPWHRRLWINDPDCLLLRPTRTDLTPRQCQRTADAVGGLGACLMPSDDLSLYRDREWASVHGIQTLQPQADSSLEIDGPFSDRPVVRPGATAMWIHLASARERDEWCLTDLQRSTGEGTDSLVGGPGDDSPQPDCGPRRRS
ncbi:MAG: hypothetical protein ABSF27_09515 [Candidatus Dormibacteria bacterium]